MSQPRKQPVYVIEVTWKRRKGKPVQPVALIQGNSLQALLLCVDTARSLGVPQSWVDWVPWDDENHSALKAKMAELLAGAQ